MRRKGIMLAEMVAAIAILGVVSITLAVFYKSLLSDVPRNFRILQTNDSLQMIVDTLRDDIDKASSLPLSSGTYKSSENFLIIDLPEGIFAYEANEDEVTKYPLNIDPNSDAYQIYSWQVPNARINWQVWRKNDSGYALETHTWIETDVYPQPRKLLADSYVFFLNQMPGGDK